ncbi:hypothetical protein P154DRAFT_582922 [Amniculicola lignicola CBS 123094]|uniref:Uncharacterized protein n=1 Tax=Amniculicola lignicola CBS 123094 TaxID=1392246 RepID=A0A6A5VWU1_9PLEO|nr:hypothetical protein P154DRAFT_582922 [Amniculicola lignicola CBS 123094]
MSTLVDFVFSDRKFANPNGTVPTTLPADGILGDGPGNFQGQVLPKSIQAGSTPIVVQSLPPPAGTVRFHVRLVFSITSIVNRTENLVEAGRLPFSITVTGKGSVAKLAVGIGSTAVGWRYTDVFSSPDILPNTWHSVDLVYDVDTLFLIFDNRPAGCHGFGGNGKLLPTNDNSLFIGGRQPSQRFNGKIAALKVETGIPSNLEDITDQLRSTPQWYITTKLETFRPYRDLGEPTESASLSIAGYCWSQPYKEGTIYWHTAGPSAFVLQGGFLLRYNQSSQLREALGYPTSDEMLTSDPVGRKTLFQKGAIYWSPATGAFEMLGKIYLQYETLGESKVWGFPLEVAQTINGGISQRTQNATWYLKNGGHTAFEVHGDILKAFVATGGIDRYGFPVTNESVVQGLEDTSGMFKVLRNVRLSNFERCSYYWSPTTGAHHIGGGFLTKWLEEGGPKGDFGLPTTDDDVAIPGGSGLMCGFEHGVINWYGAELGIQLVRSFRLFIQNVNTIEDEGAGQGENDLYFGIRVFKGNEQVFFRRWPDQGDLGGRNNRDINFRIPNVFTPTVFDSYRLSIDVWDSDQGAPFGGGDDKLGTWNKTLDASNAWGMKDGAGWMNSGAIDKIINIVAIVQPEVNIASLSEVQKWWGFRNRGFDPVDYQTYARAFRDVDSDPETLDPRDWLDGLFYKLVAKHIAKNGNCFGMSLEGIYARHSLSGASQPLNRFGEAEWPTLQPTMTTKQLYQVGASGVWWFLGQFLGGQTHNPKDVYIETEKRWWAGEMSVLSLSQNADFSGKPHVVLPVAWNGGTITVLDPNYPGMTNQIAIDMDANTFKYDPLPAVPTATRYSGTRWSGGRLHYMPFGVLSSVPRTPWLEALMLIVVGTIVIFGSDTETVSLAEPGGADLSGHGQRATELQQAGKSLNGFFTKLPLPMGGDFAGEILLSSGNSPAPPPAATPVRPPSPPPGPGQTTPGFPHIPIIPPIDLSNIWRGLYLSRSFKHVVRGKPGSTTHDYFAKSGCIHFSSTCAINPGEVTTVEATDLGTTSTAALGFTHARGKTHDVTIMHSQGLVSSSRMLRFQFNTAAAGTFKFNTRLGLGLVDFLPGPTGVTSARLTVTTTVGERAWSHAFELGAVSVGTRLKIPVEDTEGRLTAVTLGGTGQVAVARIVTGTQIAAGVNIAPPVVVPQVPH